MKLASATFISLAFMTLFVFTALADETYPATLSGTLTLQVIAPTSAQASAKISTNPQTSETLTVRVVHPPASADSEEGAEQRALEVCGAKWNAKLKAYREKLATTEEYRTYFDRWKDSPAQRPPKLPLPVLTRASYRACMAQCLHDATLPCPGGWPDEK